MRQRIEIVSLAPQIDYKTGSFGSGLILTYKKANGQMESMALWGSQMSVMETFKIQNLKDIEGKKVDFDSEEKNWEQKMSFSVVDDRIISYTDFDRLENKINRLLNILKPPETKNPPQQ